MNEFYVFLKLGFRHITDFAGYDHMLFVIVLCAVYSLSEWKKIIFIISSFTIGHCITLALSVLGIVHINSKLIELLIPITILLTALSNIYYLRQLDKNQQKQGLKYVLTLFFGLIHGLGFSNYLHSLLGIQTNIVLPLFSFNLGLEFGQIVIVTLFLVIKTLAEIKFHFNKQKIGMGISIFVAMVAMYLIQTKCVF